MPLHIRLLVLPFFVMVFSLFTFFVQAQSYNVYEEAGLPAPTVTTDKVDYTPGETAHINGSGWTLDKGQGVHIELKEEPNYPDFHNYDVTVDDHGNWQIDYLIEQRHLGVKITVIAVGKHSNYQTTTIFTDAGTASVSSLSPVRNAIAVNRATNVTVTLNETWAAGDNALKSLSIWSRQAGGKKAGTASVNGNSNTFNPTTDFKPGETVFVTTTTTSGLQKAQVFQFTTAAAASGNFSGGTSVGVGSGPFTGPFRVAPADVDGDGDLDILTANYFGNSVSVRLNNGSGSFSGSTEVAVGSGPADVATADVDGDGDLDLLTANLDGDNVSVRFNNGSGSFSGSTNIAVEFGYGPISVAPADVDGDGDLDLLIANEFGGRVNVQFNNGSGSFTSSSYVSVGSFPLSVVAADVDGDGDLDMLTANNSDNTVSVRLNNGSGSFISGSNVGVGSNPNNVVAADVDGDGDLDILASNGTSNTISIRLNNGSGSFSGSTNVAVGSRPAFITAADVDGDADLDLLTAHNSSNTVSVRLNDGSGSFSTGTNVAVGSSPSCVAAADVDGNGSLDILTADQSDNTVSVRLNQVLFIATTTSVANATTTYGNTSVNLIATVAPIPNGGSLEFFVNGTSVGSATFTDATGTVSLPFNPASLNVGTYTIHANYGGTPQYSSSSSNTGILTITTRPVTVTADTKSKYHGDSDPPLTYTITSGSLAGTDIFTGTLSRVPGEDIGDYSILQNTLSLGNNYSLTYFSALFSILDRPVDVCNGVDDDFDGEVDEGVKTIFYADADGDGFGHAAITTQACTAPAGYVSDNTDCNDNDATIYPNAPEVCDDKDNDCDGQTDENKPVVNPITGTTILCPQSTTQLSNETPGGVWHSANISIAMVNATGLVTGVAMGSTIITYTVTDDKDCQTTVQATITVEDNEAPIPDVTTLANITAACLVTISTKPTATDNCIGPITATTSDPLIYSVQGQYVINWQYDDGNGNITSQTQNVIIKDVTNPSITVPADVVTTTDVGKCSASGVTLGTPSVSDNCNGVTYQGVRSDGKDLTAAYPEGITTTITWTATDAVGNTATATQKVTVSNSTPVIASITAPAAPVPVNTTINLTVAYTDNNTIKAVIDWDDQTAAQTINAPSNPSFSVSHTYSTPGVYSVTVTLTDACGLPASSVYRYVVVYDPNGGFVTGSGWINSPAGAYKSDMTLAGRAHFGFVAKYKKGTTIPDGKTEFQFRTGNLDFSSTLYDDMRLVISGPKANFKGIGTINGIGNYGFLVSAIDGNISGGGGVDKFRIKIWDKNNGDAVVYDNNLTNTDENAEPATAISGGSIVIHQTKATNNTQLNSITLAEPESELTVKVLQNPNFTSFTLLVTGSKNEPILIRAADLLGRNVYVTRGAANQTYYFGSQFTAGMYVVQVVQGNKVRTVKVIKE